jgi:hypothetical protein
VQALSGLPRGGAGRDRGHGGAGQQRRRRGQQDCPEFDEGLVGEREEQRRQRQQRGSRAREADEKGTK